MGIKIGAVRLGSSTMVKEIVQNYCVNNGYEVIVSLYSKPMEDGMIVPLKK